MAIMVGILLTYLGVDLLSLKGTSETSHRSL